MHMCASQHVCCCGGTIHMCAGTHVSWYGGTDVQAHMFVWCTDLCVQVPMYVGVGGRFTCVQAPMYVGVGVRRCTCVQAHMYVGVGVRWHVCRRTCMCWYAWFLL